MLPLCPSPFVTRIVCCPPALPPAPLLSSPSSLGRDVTAVYTATQKSTPCSSLPCGVVTGIGTNGICTEVPCAVATLTLKVKDSAFLFPPPLPLAGVQM